MSEDDAMRDKLNALLDAGLPEHRSVPFLDFEAENDGWSFRGLAAVYDQEADLGEFTEQFMRGAFRRPLASGDNTRLIYDHSPDYVPVLATLRAKTMEIKDDVKGLVVRADIAKHYIGEAARELIRRGDIKGMSPGMIVGRGNSELTMRSNGKPHRIIKNLNQLWEVSLTPSPIYPGTNAELRSLWALQRASLELPQQPLMGAYQQLESRAVEPVADTGEEEAVPPCDVCGATPCTCVVDDTEERDSGVSEAVAAEFAARGRRLQLMGLSLPKG